MMAPISFQLWGLLRWRYPEPAWMPSFLQISADLEVGMTNTSSRAGGGACSEIHPLLSDPTDQEEASSSPGLPLPAQAAAVQAPLPGEGPAVGYHHQ